MSIVPMFVSALMVTGKNRSRMAFARVALRCFLEQTHLDKELIIVNDGAVAMGCSNELVREILLPFSDKTTLGDLRNIGLHCARGDLVIQWDDDDWHHPKRIETQAQAWQKGSAVLLQKQIRYSTINNSAFLCQSKQGIHGTILHENSKNLRYPSLRKREDTLFLESFGRRSVLDTPAPLYIRFFHGANTWNGSHIMGRYETTGSRGKWDLTRDNRQVLEDVLRAYYPHLLAK